MIKIKYWIIDYRFILLLFTVLGIAASVQSLVLSSKKNKSEHQYTHYNNYVIFKQSFFHLIDDKDLYVPYPDEHWDLYKYSPSFALLFWPFALTPDSIGVILWNLLNSLILVFAIYYLPKLSSQQKALILLACAIEAMTSLQNEQSNGLIAGLIILAFGLSEHKHYFIAAFCLVLSVYVKIFGLAGFAVFLFYPQKWKLGLYTLLWFLIIFLLPLTVIHFGQLRILYENWFNLLAHDHTPSAYGFSTTGWLKTWFHFEVKNIFVVLAGIMIFLLPFTRFKMYSSYEFRLLALASILVWVVIFNHMAESPTFIIAMAGVSIWFFMQKPTPVNVILFILAVIFTSLFTTDIIPLDFRKKFIQPYVLKAVPCIFIWGKIIIDMLVLKLTTNSEQLTVNN